MFDFILFMIFLACLCFLCVFIANFKIVIPKTRKKLSIKHVRKIKSGEGITKSAIDHRQSITHYSSKYTSKYDGIIGHA